MKKTDLHSRYFTGSCYPENMIDNWEYECSHILQIPFCYCIHNKDINNDREGRKVHVHFILAFPNTTTKNHALNVINKLSKPNFVCCPHLEVPVNIRYIYNYLIHDTDNARSKGKYQYNSSDRICCNGFDIGSFEQISIVDKQKIIHELEILAMKPEYMNFKRLAKDIIENYNEFYIEILRQYSGYLERITKGNFLDFKLDGLDLEAAQRVIDFHESNERDKRRLKNV